MDIPADASTPTCSCSQLDSVVTVTQCRTGTRSQPNRTGQGALELIAQAGGGVVEGYPQDTPGKRTSASFLYNGTRSMFEKAGFSFERTKGTKNCVMRRTVSPI